MAMVTFYVERYLRCSICSRHYRINSLEPDHLAVRRADLTRACFYGGHSGEVHQVADWDVGLSRCSRWWEL